MNYYYLLFILPAGRGRNDDVQSGASSAEVARRSGESDDVLGERGREVAGENR